MYDSHYSEMECYMITKKTCVNYSFIEQLLNEWIQANQRYVDLLGKKDFCWCYNERTNVSVLAVLHSAGRMVSLNRQ